MKTWILAKVPEPKGKVVQTEAEPVEVEGGIDTAVHEDVEADGKAKL